MMKEASLPKGVAVEKATISFDLFYELFRRLTLGSDFRRGYTRYLLFDLNLEDGMGLPSRLETVRFSQFRPRNVSIEEWIGLLGADVDNVTHAHLFHLQTRCFLADCSQPPITWPGKVPLEAQFSFEEQEILLLTGILHDWGEAFVGDKPEPSKTPEDDQQERISLEFVFGQFFSESQSPIFWGKLGQVMEILSNKESKLGRAFNAIERLGYLRTGLIAWQASQQAEADKDQAFQAIKGYRRLGFRALPVPMTKPMDEKLKLELAGNLRWLAADVLTNHVPVLVDYSKIYPPVLKYLQGMRWVVSEAFDLMPDSTFTRYDEADQALKKAHFEKAGSLWASFVKERFGTKG